MAFRLSLWYKGAEVVAQEDATDDPVVAIWNCRQFQANVLPIMRKMPYFKKVKDGDIERHIDRIEVQLPLGAPVMNGKHP